MDSPKTTCEGHRDTRRTTTTGRSAKAERWTESTRYTQQLVVENALGLHARPVAELAGVAQAFQAEIVFSCNGAFANAKSGLSLLILGAARGTELTVIADGVDAAEAVFAIRQTGHLSGTYSQQWDYPEYTP